MKRTIITTSDLLKTKIGQMPENKEQLQDLGKTFGDWHKEKTTEKPVSHEAKKVAFEYQSNDELKSTFERLSVGDELRGGALAVYDRQLCFVVPIAPMGAVRMTRMQARTKPPKVERYYLWRDTLRDCIVRANGGELPQIPIRVDIAFYFGMPQSWTFKKMSAHRARPHRQRPDKDNCEKAVLDALFGEDCEVAEGFQMKRWCRAGEERIEMIFYYEQ